MLSWILFCVRLRGNTLIKINVKWEIEYHVYLQAQLPLYRFVRTDWVEVAIEININKKKNDKL